MIGFQFLNIRNLFCKNMELNLLRLMHLADSALPIGSAAHSFGLETLTEEQVVTPANLQAFLLGWLQEGGLAEAIFCRAGWQLAGDFDEAEWARLNARMGALKPARESREASARLGRRFLALAAELITGDEQLSNALQIPGPVYHPLAFGLVGGRLDLEAELVAATYLHTTVGNMIWASQRLLPVGQSMAGQLWWKLKPAILETAQASAILTPEEATTFSPILDSASMRHPDLPTRLFIS